MPIFLLFLSFDKLVCIVDKTPVTEQEINYLSQLYPGRDPGALLDKMIMNRLIVKSASEETIAVSDEEVASEKKRLLENVPAFRTLLADPYIDSLYTEELRIQGYTTKLIQYKFRSRLQTSPIEVENFYKNYKDSLALPETVTLEQLRVPVIPEEKDRFLFSAKKILSEYQSGKDFASLANKYSEDPASKFIGGELGSFKFQDLPQYFSGVLNLSEGEADIFKSPMGYHIVKVNKRGPGLLDLAHIFLKFDFTEKELTRGKDRAMKIREAWFQGDSTLNDQITQMGTIPIQSLGYLLSSVIDTIDVSKISQPLFEGDNFYLLRITDKQKGRIPTFSEVKDNIRNLLLQEKMQKILQEWSREAKEHIYVKKL
ncbi:MAG: peptidylprolyl isomerase [candidate division WOR-3 bacterium]|nr:peptidylprolyl isomerase [candidate division WOR-3 bacterium]